MNNPQYIFSMYKLSKIYPGGKQVIKDISLSFLPGAKIGVLGGNGAGKSTLLNCFGDKKKDFLNILLDIELGISKDFLKSLSCAYLLLMRSLISIIKI